MKGIEKGKRQLIYRKGGVGEYALASACCSYTGHLVVAMVPNQKHTGASRGLKGGRDLPKR